MKIKNIIHSLLIASFIIIGLNGCIEEPEESCEPDGTFCNNTKLVTFCCTEDECIYKYNGKEYPEDNLDELATDLGCGTASTGIRSADNTLIIEQLLKLKEKVQKGLK